MIAEVVSKGEIQPLTFEIERDGEVLEKVIVPRLTEGRPRIGAYADFETELVQFGPLAALTRSLQDNYRWTKLTFVTVGRIISGKASMRHISGPIEIARYSGRAAAMGWMPLVTFMALISLQLGILNLLPIPVLDGGLIALLATEAVLGRELSLRVKENIFKLGFIFLVLLMGVVLFNDISKLLLEF
jgi:regulator of sigma E protease